MGTNNNTTNIVMPTSENIKCIIEEAKRNAFVDASALGIKLLKNDLNVLLPEISERLTDEIRDKESEDETEISKEVEDEIFEVSGDEWEDVQTEIKELPEELPLKIKNLKDYTKTGEKLPKYCLKVRVNDKVITLRKSTLCWLFSDKEGRLSSDRLLRVRGMKIQNTPKSRVPSNKFKKPRKINLSSSSSSSDDETVEYSSESELEIFEEKESENEEDVKIIKEQYYAVFYDEAWYIGRVLDCSATECCIKFLKSELDQFIWPKNEEIRTIQKNLYFTDPYL